MAKTRVFRADSVRRKFVIYDKRTGRELCICEAPIKKENLDKAAKCAKFEKYRVFSTKGGYAPVLLRNLPFSGNLYISNALADGPASRRTLVFNVCDATSVAPTRPGRATGRYRDLSIEPTKEEKLKREISMLKIEHESAKTRLIKEVKELKALYDELREFTRAVSKVLNDTGSKIQAIAKRAKEF